MPRGGQPQGQTGDYYNLGPIGGKASMAPGPQGSGAASALTVAEVAKDAPGEKAGLAVGDVIVAANGKGFKADAYFELGEAIESAEAEKKAKKAVVKLTVLRAGKKEELEIQVPHYGPDAKKFPTGKMRDAIVEKSLEWLSKQQSADGSFACHLSGDNGKVVMTSLAGLAFLSAGNTAAKGEYKATVKRAANYVSACIGRESDAFGNAGGGNWNQTNWGLGYGGIFLAEVQYASPQKGLKEKLVEVKDRILANMEASGGFAHGPGGPNALGYLELEIVSNYCLAALGGIKACGIEVEAEPVQKALDYIQACGGGKGGVGYSTREGQVGFGDPGRTGGAIAAFNALNRGDHPYYKPMVGFLKGRLSTLKDGHVSPMMHYLGAALACYADGRKSWEAFWEAQRHECTMLRNPDFSYSARPTDESQALGSNNDADLGSVWCTAHWTIILCLDRDKMPLWLGKGDGKGGGAPEDDAGKDAGEEPVTTGKEPEKEDKKEGGSADGKKKEKKKPDWDDVLDD